MSAIRELMRISKMRPANGFLPRTFFPAGLTFLRVITLGMLLLCASCTSVATVHYKITAYVRDGDIVRTGSGVWSQSVWRPLIPFITPFSGSMHGQAIPIEIPGKGYVFIIPAGPYDSDSAPWSLLSDSFNERVPGRGVDNIAFIAGISRLKGATVRSLCDYKRDRTPRAEIANAESSLRLAEGQCLHIGFASNRLKKSAFHLVDYTELLKLTDGKVYIDHISITITNEKITTGIESVLPWLGKVTSSDEYDPKDTPSRDEFSLRR